MFQGRDASGFYAMISLSPAAGAFFHVKYAKGSVSL